MRILHIIPSLQKGGAERLVLNICNELQKREGVTVKLIVLHPENEYEFLSTNIDVELCSSEVVPSISGKNNVDISDFEKIISDFKPQIIHSHLFEAEIISRWHIFKGVKYFTHCHDKMKQFLSFNFKTVLNKELLTNYYEKKRLIKQYEKCDNKFIAISKDTENYIKKSLSGKLEKNVFLLNNAIDYDRFNFTKKDVILSGIGTINLITIGSLTELKNHLFLIDVVKALNETGIGKFNLAIIGEGLMRPAIENKISGLQLQDSVRLIGLTDKVEDFLKKADLYIYSCIKEGFGLTLIEAMASGLPVICLDGIGNRDIIEQGKNGFMIFEQNPELFAQKIMELIKDKQLYTEMSLYANDYAKKFDIKGYVDKLLEIYRIGDA
jgi:glycosyltransferase involved in cell wall biosynthesis